MSKGELGIVEKAKNDLQTEADRSVQRCIMASLQKQYPRLSVFGEEESSPDDYVPADLIEEGYDEEVLKHAGRVPESLKEIDEDQIVVWVDPLDGTAEYTEGLLDHTTVLIGIAVNGQAVAGVINQPYYNYKKLASGAKLGRCIWGMQGVGSFGYDKKTKAPADKNIITTTRSHGTSAVVKAIEACEPTEILRVGGAGHKVLLVLEGRAHGYVFASPGCKKWDTCGPEAILQAAGGKLTDLHGNTYKYGPEVQKKNMGGVLAAPTVKAHKWFAERIPDEIKGILKVD